MCLLTTADDHPLDWVNAGQALQRALLTSAICGVAAALHGQPLGCRAARVHPYELGDSSYPQLVLRFGTVIQTAVSVRRPPAPASCLQAAANIWASAMDDKPGRQVRWRDLTESECFELLAHGIWAGWLSWTTAGQSCSRVDFVLDRHMVVFRTDAGTKLDAACHGSRVAFEIDGTDAAAHTGWSVCPR